MPIASWTDFTGGEAGDLGPDGCKANQFQGSNVMRYKDGSVGPRPGVKVSSPSGVAAGTVWGFHEFGVSGGAPRIAYGQNQTVSVFLPAAGTVSGVGTVSITVTATTQIISAGPNSAEMTLYGDKIYNITGSAVTPRGSSPATKIVSLYGVRVMAANTTAQPKRVYFSAASDATSWPALNFFDVGYAAWPISFLDETRQRLTISNEGGEFWALSGTPGVNDVLRRQPRADLSPLAWYHVARLEEGLWFLPLGEDFPVQYTGAVVDKLRLKHLRFTSGTGTEFTCASLPALQAVCFFEVGGSNRALMHINDAWTYHAFGAVTRFATPEVVGGLDAYDLPMFLTDGGGTSSSPAFYSFQPSLDRPGKTGDTYAQPGDNSTTPLTAYLYGSYLFSKEDHDLRVKSVTVEFFTWNTGSSSTNHFDFTVRSVFRYGPTAYKDSKTYSFDEATATTTSDKTDKRVRFTGLDNQPGHAFQWRIDNLRGAAVKAVIVDYDEVPSR